MRDLLKLARKDKLDELETAWADALAANGVSPEVFVRVLEHLASHDHEETAETLAWYLLDALRERGKLERALRAGRGAAAALPESEVVRESLAELYAEVHAERDGAERLVRGILRDSEMPTDEAVRALDTMLSVQPGSYLLDPRRAEVGRVQELDPDSGGLSVEFAEERRSYGPALIGRLEPVEEDDFRALATFEPDRLREMAEEDPEQAVQMVLSTIDRRMELRRLRIYLEPVLESWSRWWSSAKEVLKRSPLIGMTKGRSPSLFLRREPLSHAERLLRRFHSREVPFERLSMALRLLEESKQHERPNAEEMAEVGEAVLELAEGDDPVVGICAAAVVDAVASVAEREPPSEVPGPDAYPEVLAAPEELARGVPEPQLLECVLDFVRRNSPDGWRDFYADILPCLPRGVCSLAARRLEEAGADEELKRACRNILEEPGPAPGALAWVWRQGTSRQRRVPEEIDLFSVAVKILVEASATVRSSSLSEEERKRRVQELRGALFARDGEALRRVLEQAEPKELSTMKGLAEYHPALTDAMRSRLLNAVEALLPELFSTEVPPWEEDVTYTTEEGLEKRRAELEYLVNERIPEVIKEIGQAAEFGDLSENAEYSAAVEERGRLAKRASRMEEEIAEARLITPEIASAHHVTVGSRVRAKNLDTGEERTFTFLGPWDAEPAEGVLAYNAPLGQAFMGAEAGETVIYRADTERRRWEVLSVEPAV